MGTFQYPVEIREAGGQEFIEQLAWVDTGGLYSHFPADLLASLGYEPNASRLFRLADGSTVEGSIGPISLRLHGEVQPVLCVFGEGSECLIGATTLENFGLAADPVNMTLIPVVSMRLTMLVHGDS